MSFAAETPWGEPISEKRVWLRKVAEAEERGRAAGLREAAEIAANTYAHLAECHDAEVKALHDGGKQIARLIRAAADEGER